MRAPDIDETLTPLFLPSWSLIGPTGRRVTGGSQPSFSFNSNPWQSANYALYMPMYLPFRYVIRRVWWYNGNTPGGLWDVGVYSVGGGAIWTLSRNGGSTVAGAGSAGPQSVSVTPALVLSPGSYMLAIWHDSTAADQAFIATGYQAPTMRLSGWYQQASLTTGLPITATYASCSGSKFPMFGLTRTASGFLA